MRLRRLVSASFVVAFGSIACSAADPTGFGGPYGSAGNGNGNGNGSAGSSDAGGGGATGSTGPTGSGGNGADASTGTPPPPVTKDGGSGGSADAGTPTGSTDAGTTTTQDANPPSDGFDQFQHRNLDDVNQYRATLKLAPLVLDQQLCTFAMAGSQELSQDHMPHQHFINASNDGSIWTSGFTNSAAENQGDPNGWGQLANDPTQNELQQIDAIQKAMFDEGPGTGDAHGHYNNIMDSSSHRLGVGLLEVNGQLYLTNDFSQ